MGRKINRKVELLSPEQLLKRGGKLLPIILDPPGMKAPEVAALVQGHASCRQSMPPTMLRRGRQWLSNYSSSALRSIATEKAHSNAWWLLATALSWRLQWQPWATREWPTPGCFVEPTGRRLRGQVGWDRVELVRVTFDGLKLCARRNETETKRFRNCFVFRFHFNVRVV